jgi:hypothetical protein
MARPKTLAAIVSLLAALSIAAADDPLAKARQLYNQRQYEAAIQAAEQVRQTPALADSADLIAARAYLERFRGTAASDDLMNARDRLRRVNPERFTPHERTEYVVGLGETLYFDNAYGAAAIIFESILRSGDLLAGPAREHVVDWWATALDHDTRPRPEIDRQQIYQRMRERLEDELAQHPGSGAAAYWLAAAARAQGDVQAAWDAAMAGWVRAGLAIDHGAQLRGDLDRLMTSAIVPERAKALAQPPENVRGEWERFKASWSK